MPRRPITLLLPLLGSLGLALVLVACDGPKAPARGLVVLPGSTSGAPPGQAPVERPYFHDFGAVALGERPEHTFELVNTDPEPVTIQRVVPSCSCTVPAIEVFAKDGRSLGPGDFFRAEGIATVPPGGKAALKLKIETNAVQITNADKLVQVRLQSDSKTNPWLTLEAHLIVVQHLLATPGRVEFGVVPVSAGSVVEVTVRPNQLLPDQDAPRFFLAGLESATAPLRVEVYPHPNQPESAWLVLVDVPADQRQGPLIGEVRLATRDLEGRPGPSLVLPVNGQIGPDFAVDPPRAFLRRGAEGGAMSARLELISRLSGAPFRIASYDLGPNAEGDLKFEATPIEPNAEGLSSRWELIIRAYPDQKPPAGTLGVLLDGPRPARLEIPYEPYRQP